MGSAGQISLVFQFKTDFTDTNRLLNLALNPHLLYTLLVAVYLFYIYFKNTCKKVLFIQILVVYLYNKKKQTLKNRNYEKCISKFKRFYF